MQNLVTVYQDVDFGGSYQSFPPGEYKIGDNLSSLKVPLGMSVALFENEFGTGKTQIYEVGDYSYVGNDFNDKASLMKVYNWTTIYLSNEYLNVPPLLENFVFSFSSLDGTHYQGSISSRFEDSFYSKTIKYPIPVGFELERIEMITANGKTDWTHYISDGVLNITVSVHVNSNAFGPRSWIIIKFFIK